MSLFGTKHFCQVDRFINHDLVRNLDAIEQFVGTHAQDYMFDDVKLIDRAIKKGADFFIDLVLIFADLSDQRGEQFGINIAEILFLTKLGKNLTNIQTGQVPLV